MKMMISKRGNASKEGIGSFGNVSLQHKIMMIRMMMKIFMVMKTDEG